MKHILLVDDNAASLNHAENIVKSTYKVTCLTSGATALKFLQKQCPDLILLDINMPGMSGFDVVKEIKLMPHIKKIPIIFITSQSDPETEGLALSLGVQDFISKPMVPQTAMSRIKMHLELFEYREQLEDIILQKTEMLTEMQGLLSESISELVEQRDGSTGSHIKRIRFYVDLITTKLMEKQTPGYQINGDFKVNILRAAPLHDIGKIKVLDQVLMKPDKLTFEEMEHVKNHTIWGAEAVHSVAAKMYDDEFLVMVEQVIRHHHEKWNGTGYPDQLKGEGIPLCARIMSIADVYDALVSARPYKKPFPHEAAIDIMKKDKETAFDPILTDVFLDAIEQYRLENPNSDEEQNIENTIK